MLLDKNFQGVRHIIMHHLDLVKTIKHRPHTLIRAVKDMRPIYSYDDLQVADHKDFYRIMSYINPASKTIDIFKFNGDYLLPTDFGLVAVDIRKLKVIG
jgi:hypothetical protein